MAFVVIAAPLSQKFLDIGAGRYRDEDYYDQPDPSLRNSDLPLVETAMRQLSGGNGFELNWPLTDIGNHGMHMLMPILHFRLASVVSHYAEGGVNDECTGTHITSEVPVTLFNFVASPHRSVA